MLSSKIMPRHKSRPLRPADARDLGRPDPPSAWRSGCPLNASVEILGDRWSLLIIRDMMLRGFHSYKEFLDSYEGIATNILADRLRKLEQHRIITTEEDHSDGRKVIYVLTEKGMDLAPVLTEMVLWAAAHEDTQNRNLVQQILKDKRKFVAAIRERWSADHLRRNAAISSVDRKSASGADHHKTQ
jgi:DNA-binding HxlR family transcriptional regulator